MTTSRYIIGCLSSGCYIHSDLLIGISDS